MNELTGGNMEMTFQGGGASQIDPCVGGHNPEACRAAAAIINPMQAFVSHMQTQTQGAGRGI